MKKLHWLTLILNGLLAVSCVSNVNTSRANIDYQQMSFSELSRSDYEILGRVDGESTITENVLNGERMGDTFQYGYLGDIGYSGNLEKYSITQKTVIDVPKNPEDQARRNAIYILIQEANKLDADSVIFVQTQIDQKIEKTVKTYHVKVSGLAVKIK